jgi:predicted porin
MQRAEWLDASPQKIEIRNGDMSNAIVAAALLAISATAVAQSNVTLYGVADAGFVQERGGAAGTVNKLTSGVASASRIGLRGSEDLGGGLAAFFTLEAGYRIDSGEIDAAGAIFNRQAFVGLRSRVGTVTVGRQYTPYHSTLVAVADPFGTGMAGSSKSLFPDSGTNVRTSNTVLVSLAPQRGVSAELAYSAGEQAGNSGGRQAGGAIGYTHGPFTLRLAYNNKKSTLAAAPAMASGINTLLAANYDFGGIKAFAAYGIDRGYNSAPLGNANNPYGGVKPLASERGAEILLGLSASVGPGTLLASIQHKNDKTALDQDADAWGIGYVYPLSKRNNLYGAWGAINNQNGAGYTVANNTESGSGNRALNLGIRHTF